MNPCFGQAHLTCACQGLLASLRSSLTSFGVQACSKTGKTTRFSSYTISRAICPTNRSPLKHCYTWYRELQDYSDGSTLFYHTDLPRDEAAIKFKEHLKEEAAKALEKLKKKSSNKALLTTSASARRESLALAENYESIPRIFRIYRLGRAFCFEKSKRDFPRNI
jgi:hypothetical protein